MVPSLRSLSIKASFQDLANLKHYINIVPRAILYDLVQYCFSDEPKKTLAFQTLFQNWPFDSFSIQSIGITLDADDIVLILYAIQMGQFGSIKNFDLVQKEFSSIESQTAEQYIKLTFRNSPSLNTDLYGNKKQMSPSHGDIVKNAETLAKEERNNASLSYQNGAKYTGAKKEDNDVILSDQDCKEVFAINNDDKDSGDATKMENEITIYADIYVEHLEIAVILAEEVLEKNNLLIKLIPVRIKFGYLPSKQIEYMLGNMINTNNIRYLDLSFSNLKICEDSGGHSLTTESVSKFSNLEHVCLAYSGLSATGFKLFVDCFKQLPNLKRLDLSGNSFVESLCDFFNSNLKSKYLKELILTGCNINKSILDAMAGSKCLSFLEKLKLNINVLTAPDKEALKNVLIRYKSTLIYLDISNCGLDNEDISDIRSIINDSVLLVHC